MHIIPSICVHVYIYIYIYTLIYEHNIIKNIFSSVNTHTSTLIYIFREEAWEREREREWVSIRETECKGDINRFEYSKIDR